MSPNQPSATSLAIFAPTADQRYLLGPELFLRTHFPVTLRRFQNGSVAAVDEAALLARLLADNSGATGNRIFVLYGAPGSGKSELMRWLQTQVERRAPNRSGAMIRVSRTELDVLSIVERFKHLLAADTFSELTHQRWQAVRQKPRTLSKLLVLSALEKLLASDEQINAIYYRLLNSVQPIIECSLGASETDGELAEVELISREVWTQIQAESAITIPLDYERFRQQMLAHFRQHLLEGLDLPDTLRQISARMQQAHGVRPLLLVDDLVQSLNLFATDLLDYFITLKEGQWDVVLGLTPAAFESSQRGRELLQRIAYLDTIDDRVEKLWLSDEAGRDSYVLTEANCHQFAARYLAEYQRHSGLNGVDELYPFNQPVLVRIFRGLPTGKGKARYFLRALRAILSQVAEGESLLAALDGYARTEFVARTANSTLAAATELFGPLLPDQTVREVTLPADLLAHFDLPAQATTIAVEPLFKLKLRREAITQIVDDDEKAAVRDWLLGREVNRQLLRPLRQGAARLLRRIAPPDVLHRPGIAKPSGALHWRQPLLGIQPPICLEAVDDEGEGIRVSREIGLLAFDLHRYATAKGRETTALEASLAAEPEMLPVFFGAADFRRRLTANLEQQLGLPLETLALALYSWGLAHLSPTGSPIPAPLKELLPTALQAHLTSSCEQQAAAWQDWQLLFDDFFRLRENLYDSQRVAILLSTKGLEPLWALILEIEPERVDKSHRWAKRLFSNALAEWQVLMRQKIELESQTGLSREAQTSLTLLSKKGKGGIPLIEFSPTVLVELKQVAPEIYHQLLIVLDHSSRE